MADLKVKKEKNWGIIGHEDIIKYLRRSIEADKIAQAYLFIGPEGLGKKEVALMFLKTLVCRKRGKNFSPCLNCENCLNFNLSQNPDITFIKRAEKKKMITIEQIRRLIEHLNLKAVSLPYKIALIDEADLMTEKASNSFLKTLEEPKAKTVIILISKNEKFLPETIVSRCQVIRFNLVPNEKIYDYFLREGISHQKAEYFTNIAQGRIIRAKKLVKDPEFYKKFKDELDRFLSFFKEKNIVDRFQAISELTKKISLSEDIFKEYEYLLDIWLTSLRDMLLIKSGSDNEIVYIFKKKQYQTLAKGKKISYFKKLIDYLVEARVMINHNLNPKIILENFILRI